MIRKVINYLESSEAHDFDWCGPLVILNNCEPWFSVIFSISIWKNLAFRLCQKLSSVVTLIKESEANFNFSFRNVKKFGFSWFLIWFRVVSLDTDFLTVVADRITRLSTCLVLLGVWHLIWFSILVFFTSRKSYGISGQIFSLIPLFLCIRLLHSVLDRRSP